MPTPGETDVVVLGVGTCGEDVALQLLDAGLEVVGIEKALVGGECPCTIGAYGRGVTTVLDPDYSGLGALDAVGGAEAG